MKENTIAQIIYLLCLVLLSLGCHTKDGVISGTWEFIGQDNCFRNPLGLLPYSYPSHQYGHKLYISESAIYNPAIHSRIGEIPQTEYKYETDGKFISTENGVVFKFEIQGDILLFKQSECQLTFKRVQSPETLSSKNIANVLLSIKDEEFLSVTSISINRNQPKITTGEGEHKIPLEDIHKYVEQVFRLVDSIHVNDVNRTFDEGISDSYECTLHFFADNGEVLKIVTYGKLDTPFEVKTLLSHLFRAICW